MRSAVLLGFLTACHGPVPKPNVLVFTLDTTRADAMGGYGNKSGATPNFDRMAKEGVLFENAYTPVPLTIPAHSSLFTGLLPPRNGVRDNGDCYLGDGALTLAEVLKGAGWATMASVGAEVTSHHWGFAQGFDTFDDDMGSPGARGNRWEVERPGSAVTDDALRWLEAQPGDKPWFAWVHLFDAHHPYKPIEPFASRYPNQPYQAEVASVDVQVGRVLDLVARRGDMDRTWILLMSDHGESLGAHGESMHGVLLYDPTTHVPLVIRPPGGSKVPHRIEDPVSLVDVMPTVLDALGLPLPPHDGQSLLPMVKERPDQVTERAIYMESMYAWRHFGWAPQLGLVTPEWKLLDSTTPELYATSDRVQKSSQAAAMPQVTTAMRERLDSWAATLEPTTTSKQTSAVSPERLSQLEALGYMTTGSELGEPTEGLPDPVAHLGVLRQVDQARMALQSGDLVAAQAQLEALVAEEPGLAAPKGMLAQVLLQQGQIERAVNLLTELDSTHPSSESHMKLGLLRLQMGAKEEALDLLESAIEMDPYQVVTWTSYLNALVTVGDIQRLDAELDRARGLLGPIPGLMGPEAILLRLQGDSATADTLLRGALAQDPDQPQLNLVLGQIAKEKGHNSEAEAFFQEELVINPLAVPARAGLVEILAEERRYDEQLEQLKVIASQEPPNYLTWHSTAQALFNLRRYPEAEAAIRTCRDLAPTYPACAMLQANVLKKLGRAEEAEQAYREALEIGKTAQDVLKGAKP